MEKKVIERFSTGVDGLDEILCGGLLRGSAYIVQGLPGAGKTILANQLNALVIKRVQIVRKVEVEA